MRHLKKGKKFHRERASRQAFLKLLAESLILKEKFTTTVVRAKELKRYIEKKISLIKDDKLNSSRNLSRYFSKNAVKKLIKMSDRLKTRKGGWTRIIRIGARKSDGTEMAKIEIIK